MKQKLLLIASCFIPLMNAMESKKLILVPCTTEIPKDVSHIIWKAFRTSSTYSSLVETVQTFKTLTCVNKSFKSFFYDSKRLLPMLKEMSSSFNSSDEKIVDELSFNKKIRKLARLQESFLNYCKQDIESTKEEISLKLSRYQKDGIDFDFTYGSSKNTALITVLTATKWYSQQSDPTVRILSRIHTDFGQKIITYLIYQNADVYLRNNQGYSALSYILLYHQNFLNLLQDLGKLEPNQHRASFAKLHSACSIHPRNIDFILKAAQILVDAGVDPECKYKISPDAPGFKDNPQFVTFMEEAIRKKHAIQKSEQ